MRVVCQSIFLFVLFCSVALGQNRTDVSLFMRNAPKEPLAECLSDSGDMYMTLGHHGPAIENEYVAFRMFFDRKMAIDVYSKKKKGRELDAAQWYPTPEQQKKGFGGDYYHVGDTVGLGGLRLWDGEEVVALDPVTSRYGRVVKEGTVSFLEVLSRGVPYKGAQVDVRVRVTVFSGFRNAKVEVFALSDGEIQFVTGLNHRKGVKMRTGEDYIFSWGPGTGEVADGQIEVGAAVMFEADDFEKQIDDEDQTLFVSKPCKYLEYWISSANSWETELNSLEKFEAFVAAAER